MKKTMLKMLPAALLLSYAALSGMPLPVLASSTIYGVSWDWDKDGSDYTADITFSFKTTDGNSSLLKFEVMLYAGGKTVGDKYLTYSSYTSGDVVSKSATVTLDDISYNTNVRLWIKAYNNTIESAYELAAYTDTDRFPYGSTTSTATSVSFWTTYQNYILLGGGFIILVVLLFLAWRFLGDRD